MAWTLTNPVSIGNATKKSHYDTLWDNCDFFKIEHDTSGGHTKAITSLTASRLMRTDASKIPASSAMAETANGEVSNASQPAFQAYTASGQANHAKDAYVTVFFDGEVFDQGGDFNIGTYTFTAPVTGKYQLNLILNLDQLADDSSVYQVEIVTSNHNYYNFINPNKLFEVGEAPQHCFTMSVLADMDAADTAFVRVYQTGGTVQTDIPQNYSSFSGYLAC